MIEQLLYLVGGLVLIVLLAGVLFCALIGMKHTREP